MHSLTLILIGAQLYAQPSILIGVQGCLNPNAHAALLVRCSLKPNPHAAFIATVVHAQPRPNPNRHAALMQMRQPRTQQPSYLICAPLSASYEPQPRS